MEKVFAFVASLLVLVGALNWGFVGAFDFNLVESIFGMGHFTKAVYILVGLSALYGFYAMVKEKYMD